MKKRSYSQDANSAFKRNVEALEKQRLANIEVIQSEHEIFGIKRSLKKATIERRMEALLEMLDNIDDITAVKSLLIHFRTELKCIQNANRLRLPNEELIKAAAIEYRTIKNNEKK